MGGRLDRMEEARFELGFLEVDMVSSVISQHVV